MKYKIRKILFFVGIIALGMGIVFGLTRVELPEETEPVSEGAMLVSGEEARNIIPPESVVVIEVTVSTTCPECSKLVKELKKYERRPYIQIVYVINNASYEEAELWVNEHGVDPTRAVYNVSLGVTGYPTTIIYAYNEETQKIEKITTWVGSRIPDAFKETMRALNEYLDGEGL